MAASIEQKLDFLLKKIGYVASKTGIAEDSSLSGTKKAPFGEAISSPLVVPESSVWAQANEIPATPPGSDTSFVRVYLSGSSGHRMTADNTVSGNRTFIARSTYNNNSSPILGDWIDTSFGADYIIEVYKGDPLSGGVKLSAAGSGSNDTWFFDYSSGVLNFNGTVVPSGVTSSNIYIVGYRYVGIKGVAVPGAGVTFTDAIIGDLNITGVSTFAGLVDINAGGQANTFKVEDLTDNRVVIAGSGGELEDDTNLTFNGTQLAVGVNLDVDGHTELDNLNVSGVSTFTGNAFFQSNVHLGDNDQLRLGDSNEFKVIHRTAGDSTITSSGAVYIGSTAKVNIASGYNTNFMARFTPGGSSELYHNYDKVFETTGYGVTVFGTTQTQHLNVTGVSTFQGNVNLGDNDQIIIGDGSDLKIYHDGSNSYVEDAGVGALIMKGSTIRFRSTANENIINASQNGSVDLYYDNSKKFETTASGIDVTGHTETDTLRVSGVSTFQSHVHLGDDDELRFGANNDFKIYHDPNDARIENSNGDIKFKNTGSYFFFDEDGGETLASFINDGAANLFHSGSKKFETTASGINVTGHTETDTLNVSGVSTFRDDVKLTRDNRKLIFGDNDDLEIFHDGSNNYIVSNNGSFNIKSSSFKYLSTSPSTGRVRLFHSNSARFETTGIGVSIVNGTSDTATITGPSNLIIDPVVVGDNTGIVRIKGDLFVDGNTTQINSTSLEIADFIVGIASTATTDLLTDGAGIKIGPNNTFLYEHNAGANPSLKSSENLNVAAGKVYQIGETERLSADTLSVGTGATIHSPASNTLTLGTNGSEKLRITSDGKVGIGTDIPELNSKLHTFTTQTTARTITETTAASGYAGYRLTNGTGYWEMQVDGSNQGLRFLDDGTEKVRITSDGRLLVGTTSSSGSHILEVNSGTDNEGIKVVSTDAGSYIRFADNSTTAQIRLGAVGNDFKIDVNSSERLRITSDGDVGIGVADPDVYSLGGNNRYAAIKASAGYTVLNLVDSNNSGSYLQFGNSSVRRGSLHFLSNSDFVIASNASNSGTTLTERLRIKSGGRIGIETDDPTERLTVHGTNNDTTPILGLRSGNGQTTTNNGAQIAFGFNGTNHYQHFIHTRHNTSNNNNAIDFYVCDGTQQNTVTSGSVHTLSMVSGKVGIGTIDPLGTLHVSSGTSGDATLILEADTDNSNDADNPYILFKQDGGISASAIGHGVDSAVDGNVLTMANSISDGSITFATGSTNGYTNATERVRIDSSGRLLVGTTTEGAALADNLTVADTGDCGITIRSGASNYGSIYFSDATSGAAEYRGQIEYNHNTDILRVYSGGTAVLRIDPGKLEVIGNTETDTLNVTGISTFQDDVKLTTDNKKLIFGDNDDLEIFHNGVSNYIVGNTGSITLKSPSFAYFLGRGSDGLVRLFHGNSTRFETTGYGVTVFGTTQTQHLNVTGISTFTGSETNFEGLAKIQITNNGQALQLINTSNANNAYVDQRFNIDGHSRAGIRGQIFGANLGGILRFYTAANSQVLTERAVIDQNGNFGINVTSPTETLDVGGTTQTQHLNVSGISTFQSHVELGDDDELRIGDNRDLRLYHDGSNSYVADNGVGSLILASTFGGVFIRKHNVSETMAGFNPDSSVDLYYNGDKKFETTASGIDVTGHTETDTLNVSGISTFAGKVNADGGLEVSGGVLTANNNINTSAVRRTSHTNTRLAFPANNEISLQNSSGSILRVKDDRVGINSVTPRSELDVRGNVIVSGITTLNSLQVETFSTFNGNTKHFDGKFANFGNSTDLQIVHDGTNSVIQNATGQFFIDNNSSGGDLFLRANDDVIIRVDGNDTVLTAQTGGIDVTGHTETDTLRVSGISTFSGDISIADKIIHTGDTNTAIRFPAADTITAETAGSERLRITSAGDVGIGTDNPLQKLHLVDNTSANIFLETKNSTTGSTSGIYFRTSDSSTDDAFFKTAIVLEDDGTSFARGKLHILQDNTADDSNATLSDSVVTIDQSGNVGIGTDNLSAKITVYSTISDVETREIRIDASDAPSGSAAAGLYRILGDQNASGKYLIGYNSNHSTQANQLSLKNADGDITFHNANNGLPTEKLRITSDGKVNVNQSSGVVGSKFNIFNGSDTENILGITGTDESSEYAAIGVSGGNAVFTGGGAGTTSTGIVFRTAASGTEAERLRITSDGDITTSGSITTQTSNTFYENNRRVLEVHGGTTQGWLAVGATRTDTDAYVGGINFINRHGQTDNHRFLGYIRLKSKHVNTGVYGTNVLKGQLEFATKSSGAGISTTTPDMVISPSGDVGIGTDNPEYSLDLGKTPSTIRLVSGNNGTAIRMGAGGGGNDFTLIRVDGSSQSGFNGQSNSSAFGFSLKYMGSRNNNDNSLSLFSDNQAGTQVEAVTVLQDGKVGIGSAVPQAKLDVDGVINSQTDIRVNDVSVLTSAENDAIALAIALG